jgi:hypothetical protein
MVHSTNLRGTAVQLLYSRLLNLVLNLVHVEAARVYTKFSIRVIAIAITHALFRRMPPRKCVMHHGARDVHNINWRA